MCQGHRPVLIDGLIDSLIDILIFMYMSMTFYRFCRDGYETERKRERDGERHAVMIVRIGTRTRDAVSRY